MTRRVAVLYNCRAGYWLDGGEPGVRERLAALFAPHAVAAELYALGGDPIAATVDRALADGADTLFVAGGDGTLLAAAEALAGRVPLAPLPCGTMNVLARDLGIPAKLDQAIAALVDGRVDRIDVAYVNDRPFLCSSVLGLMPQLGRLREQARGGDGWRGRVAALRRAWSLWRRYPRLGVAVTADAISVRVRTRAIAVSNNPLRDERGPLPGRDSIATGLLGVYVQRDRSTWTLARVAARLVAGTWQDDPDLLAAPAKEVVVDFGGSRRLTVMNDGEAMTLETPLRYRIAPRTLPVVVPA